MEPIPSAIVNAAIAAAEEEGKPVAELAIEAIARQAGVSRATLFRRIGSRHALEQAVRARGVDPGGRLGVRERAVSAAASIVRVDGLAALTLERVATLADCSLPALHRQIGGRDALLAAMFERYSPLPRIERLVASPPASFEATVRQIYRVIFDAATAEPRLVQAVLADAVGRPGGPAARYVTGVYVPRLVASVGAWLAAEVAAGRCRALPLPLLGQLLIAPMGLHAMTRSVVERATGVAPPRDEIIDQLTDAYCRAVALPPPRND